MRLKWTVLAGWITMSIVGRVSGEHPMEHPSSDKSMEHPEKKKAAKRDIKKVFSKAVKDYVEEQSAENEGLFIVRDKELNKDWKLKLVRIHKDKIVELQDGRFFACADFQEAKKKSPAKVDLDFYAKGSDTDWQIEEVLIHKVAGKPRFTYDANNNRIPIGKAQGATSGRVDQKASYVCPMDGYKSDRPGKCAKCGMDLERREQ